MMTDDEVPIKHAQLEKRDWVEASPLTETAVNASYTFYGGVACSLSHNTKATLTRTITSRPSLNIKHHHEGKFRAQ